MRFECRYFCRKCVSVSQHSRVQESGQQSGFALPNSSKFTWTMTHSRFHAKLQTGSGSDASVPRAPQYRRQPRRQTTRCVYSHRRPPSTPHRPTSRRRRCAVLRGTHVELGKVLALRLRLPRCERAAQLRGVRRHARQVVVRHVQQSRDAGVGRDVAHRILVKQRAHPAASRRARRLHGQRRCHRQLLAGGSAPPSLSSAFKRREAYALGARGAAPSKQGGFWSGGCADLAAVRSPAPSGPR